MPQFISADSILPWLRASGVPSELTDEDMVYLLSSALSRYSKMSPLIAGRTLQLISGQQDYALPNNWIEVKQVLYHPWGDPPVTSWEGMRIWWMQSLADDYIFDNPSLSYVWFDKFAIMTEMHGGIWQSFTKSTEAEDEGDPPTIEKILRLMPPPPRDGTLPILGHLMRTIDQIEETDRDLFRWMVLAETASALINKYGVVDNFSDSGMNVSLSGGLQRYIGMAERAESMIQSYSGPVGTVVMTRG